MKTIFTRIMIVTFILLHVNCAAYLCNNTADKGPAINEVERPLSDEEIYEMSIKQNGSQKNKNDGAPVVTEIQNPMSNIERQKSQLISKKEVKQEYGEVYFAFLDNTLYLSGIELGNDFEIKGKVSKKDNEIIVPWNSIGVDENRITKVTIMNEIHPSPSLCIFAGLNNLLEIENLEFYKLNGWNSLQDFFHNCKSLKAIDLGKLDTKGIEDWSYMFDGCTSLESINLTSVDMSNAVDLSHMFNNCSSLKVIALKNDMLKKVKTIHKMFSDCVSLEKIDLSTWFFNSLEDASQVFSNCKNLIYVNLNNPTTVNLKDMSYMFNDCVKLEKVDMKSLDIRNISDIRGMFTNTDCISEIEFNHIELNNINIYADDMYNGCKNLKKPDIYVLKNSLSLKRVFNNCPNVEEVDASMIASYNGAIDILGFSGMSKLNKIVLKRGQRIDNGLLANKVLYVD